MTGAEDEARRTLRRCLAVVEPHCRGKRRHLTENAAAGAAVGPGGAGAFVLTVYRCLVCDTFHTGNGSGRRHGRQVADAAGWLHANVHPTGMAILARRWATADGPVPFDLLVRHLVPARVAARRAAREG